MTLISWFAVYFVLWWLCLFIVLPFRVHNQSDTGEHVQGTERGAPVMLRLWPKLLATTILAAILQIVLLWLLSNPMLQEYWS